MKRPGRVLQKLLEAEGPVSWWAIAEDHDTVRVMIWRVRRKLGADAVERVRGVGYQLSPAARAALERG